MSDPKIVFPKNAELYADFKFVNFLKRIYKQKTPKRPAKTKIHLIIFA